ncbi:O-antigen ligase family protein [Haloprofundus salilacus]|uniref:O-antigen ligase family protein n=1 Tax=Haloprofundus salilacus TaxID=2876190 RepID=UPI001CCF7294|nr:O-antigen ligase family protein [Haloprofundus salilacus]
MRPAYRHGIVSSTLLLPVTLFLGIILQEILVPLPGLISLALTLVTYGGYIVYTEEYRIGFLAAFATAATISADIPVLEETAAFAGPSVGSIFLIEIIAIPGIAYLLYDWREWDHVELLLTAYSVWAAISVVFGIGPAKAAGFWFAAYSFLGVISYAIFRRAIQRRIVSCTEAVSLFLFAGAGQGLIAALQLIHTANFGLTTLGEGANSSGVYISLFLYKVPIGTYISGFMSMSFELANYLVLLLPVIIAFAILKRQQRWSSIALGSAAVIAAVGVRVTMSDAARGGLIIALGVFIVALLAMRVDNRIVVAAVIPILPAFIRSTTSGQGVLVNQETSNPSTGPTAPENPTTTPTSPTGNPDPVNISIPFFDLSNLGVRLQQYIIGIQMFINHPLFGVGAANYQLVAMGYDAPYPPGGEFPYSIHSIYITLLAETGLPGFFLYTLAGASVVLGGLYYGVREQNVLLSGLACGLLGTFAFGSLDILQLYYPTAFVPIWAVAGIAGAICGGIHLPTPRGIFSR